MLCEVDKCTQLSLSEVIVSHGSWSWGRVTSFPVWNVESLLAAFASFHVVFLPQCSLLSRLGPQKAALATFASVFRVRFLEVRWLGGAGRKIHLKFESEFSFSPDPALFRCCSGKPCPLPASVGLAGLFWHWLAEFRWSAGKCCRESAMGRVGSFHGGTALQKTRRIILVWRDF